MKIGFLTAYSDKEIEFARKHGFKSVELLVDPGQELDPSLSGSQDTILRAKEKLAKYDIEVSAIGYYANHLSPCAKEREVSSQHLIRLMDLCQMLEVKTLGVFAGRDPEKDIADNIPAFKEVFIPIAKQAEDKGLRIAFENCPMFHYFPFRGINIAYCPRAWDLMFEAVPSPALGLEYDPSHLVCLSIDYLEIIYKYGAKIFHVHAKDAELLERNIRVNGILEPGAVRHRTPGYGDVDWSKVISALVEIGYRGNLDIEGQHDPVFCGDREGEGLILSQKHLNQFIVT